MHKNVVKGATSSYRYHVPSMKSVTIPPHVHPLTVINTCHVVTLGFLFPLKTLDPPQTALPLCVTAERVTCLSTSTKGTCAFFESNWWIDTAREYWRPEKFGPCIPWTKRFIWYVISSACVSLSWPGVYLAPIPTQLKSFANTGKSEEVFPLKVLNSTLRHTALWSIHFEVALWTALWSYEQPNNQTVGLLQVVEFIFFLSSFFSVKLEL